MKFRFPLFLLCGALAAPSVSHAQGLLDKFPVQPAPGKSSSPSKNAPNAKRMGQKQVAAKGNFPVVKAGDAALKGALSATDLATAKKMVGHEVKVVGTIAKVYAPKSNNLVLLNFAKDYKTALVGAIKAQDFAKFPDLSALAGKKVLLTGKMVMFKGAPEVELVKAGAIRVVK